MADDDRLRAAWEIAYEDGLPSDRIERPPEEVLPLANLEPADMSRLEQLCKSGELDPEDVLRLIAKLDQKAQIEREIAGAGYQLSPSIEKVLPASTERGGKGDLCLVSFYLGDENLRAMAARGDIPDVESAKIIIDELQTKTGVPMNLHYVRLTTEDQRRIFPSRLISVPVPLLRADGSYSTADRDQIDLYLRQRQQRRR